MHWHFAFRFITELFRTEAFVPWNLSIFRENMRTEVNAEPSSIYMVAMNMHTTHAQQVVIEKPGV